MAEIKVTDLAEETAESLDGSESFVMFDNTSGKRGTVTSIGAYILSKLTTKLGGISRTVSAAIESIETTLSAHASAISSKQDKLTFDSAPASGSKNPVTSGGIYSALAGKQSTGDYATHGDLSTGLAGKQDKLTFDATPTASSTKPVTSGGIKTALDKKQDKLSIDSSPTSGSSNPVSSGGVYTALAGKQPKGSYLTQTDLDNALAAKQDVLTMDTSPKSGSGNPITSGGVYSALTGYATNTALAKKQDKLTFDTAPTASSTKPVTSGGVKAALDKKQDTIGASTALAAASLAATGNVAGATFNGFALGDMLKTSTFMAKSDFAPNTNKSVSIPYTLPSGYKLVGLCFAWLNAPQTFIIGQSVDENAKKVTLSIRSNNSWTDVACRAVLLFIRNI